MEHINPYLFGMVLTGWLLLFAWGLLMLGKRLGEFLESLYKGKKNGS